MQNNQNGNGGSPPNNSGDRPDPCKVIQEMVIVGSLNVPVEIPEDVFIRGFEITHKIPAILHVSFNENRTSIDDFSNLKLNLDEHDNNIVKVSWTCGNTNGINKRELYSLLIRANAKVNGQVPLKDIDMSQIATHGNYMTDKGTINIPLRPN